MANVGLVYRMTIFEHFYYGSTRTSLQKRLQQHKYDYTKHQNKLYSKVSELGVDNLKIECIETVNYNERSELLTRERFYIEKHIQDEKCLNSTIPYRTKEEKALRSSEYLKQKRLEEKLANPKPERIMKSDDPDYNKNRWQEWANKNREHLRQYSKIYEQTRRYE